jgi:RimJ/RimL family protein N-acetyltransferase
MADNAPRPISLRYFDGADARKLTAWLKLPHVVAWWGGLAAAEASLALAASSETSLRCLIVGGSEPIGYGHAIDASLTGADRLADVPPGAFEIDLFIADAAYQGRGVGVDALHLMAEELFASLVVSAAVVRMPVATEGVVRALERRGFRWIAIDRTPANPPRWVLIKARP